MARNDPGPDNGFSLPNPPAINNLNVLSTLARSRLANSVRPFAYAKNLEGEPSTTRNVFRAATSFLSGSPDMEAGVAPDRQDAWRTYLGLGQKNNTYQPSEAPPDSILRKSGFFSEADSSEQFIQYANPENRRNIREDARRLIESDKSVMRTQDKMNRESYLEGDTTRVGNLGHYTLRKGEDEQGSYVSYEDKWDISVNPLEGTVGDPMNVYGKMRYNPETGEFMDTDKKAHGGFIDTIYNRNRKALYGPNGDVKYANPDRQYGIGGFLRNNASTIGTVAGAAIGTAAGGNTALGATIGGSLGRAVQSTGQEEEQDQSRLRRPLSMRRTPTYATLGNEGNFAKGGMIPMGQGAAKFKGPSHANGGIDVGNNTEVEGGETVDFIYDDESGLMDGEGNPYVFSDRLTLPDSETTFSEAHESLVESGAGEEKIRQLAKAQEKVSGRSNGNKKMQEGGKIDPPVAKADKTRAATIRERYPNIATGSFSTDAALSTLLRNQGVNNEDIKVYDDLERGGYNPLTENISVDKDRILGDTIAELAHKKQDENSLPGEMTYRAAKGLVTSGDLAGMITSGRDPRNRYRQIGTLEQEAHGPIENDIWFDYGDLAGGENSPVYSNLGEEDKKAYGGRVKRKMKDGGKYHAIKASETSGDDPKYPINSAGDVTDAWNLRSHGDYNISQKKLEQRIRRKANEYDVDLPDSKAYGGKMRKKYPDGGIIGDKAPALDPEKFGFSVPNRLSGTGPSVDAARANLSGEPGYMDNINQGNSLLEGKSGQAIQAGAQALPAIANLIRGQQDVQEPKSSFVPMSGRATDTLRGMETDVNVDPQLASTRASLRAITTNPNASANERLAAMSSSNRQRSKIQSTAENRETQLENRRRQRIAQSEQNVAQSNTRRLQRDLARRNEVRRRSQAAKQNLTSTGIRQLSTGVQDFFRRRRMEDAQEAQLAMQTLMADPAVSQGAIEDLGKALPENRYISKLSRIGN